MAVQVSSRFIHSCRFVDLFVAQLATRSPLPDTPANLVTGDAPPAGVNAGLWALVKSCWSPEAADRPTAADIVTALADIVAPEGPAGNSE